MELINTISIGELIVGIGTLALAFVTFFVTVLQIREARRIWDKEAKRQYKSGLLIQFERWVQEVVKALTKDMFDAKKWFTGTETKDYFSMKAELLTTLLTLRDTGWFFEQKGEKSFEKYKFKERLEKLIDKYGDCTDKLHTIVDPKSTEQEQDEESDCEMELLNMATDFHKFINEIMEKEKIS